MDGDKRKVILITIGVLAFVLLVLFNPLPTYRSIAASRPDPTPETHEEFEHEDAITLQLSEYSGMVTSIAVYDGRADSPGEIITIENEKDISWILTELSGEYVWSHWEYFSSTYHEEAITGGHYPRIRLTGFDANGQQLFQIHYALAQDGENSFYYTDMSVPWLYHHYKPSKAIDWETFDLFFDIYTKSFPLP